MKFFKKFVATLACVSMLFMSTALTGCGDTKVIDGVEYDTYGLINRSDKYNPNIRYEAIVGNVVWSILLVPIGTVYFLGFSVMEPVAKKSDNFIPGKVG